MINPAGEFWSYIVRCLVNRLNEGRTRSRLFRIPLAPGRINHACIRIAGEHFVLQTKLARQPVIIGIDETNPFTCGI